LGVSVKRKPIGTDRPIAREGLTPEGSEEKAKSLVQTKGGPEKASPSTGMPEVGRRGPKWGPGTLATKNEKSGA